MAKKRMTYAGAGVDIDAGDVAVDRIKTHLKRTYGPRVLGKDGGFAGCFRLDYNQKLFKRNYRDPVLVSCTDGVGSKVMLAIEMGICDTVGQDVVAMNVNDMIVQGAEPLFFLDYIGIHKIIPELIEQIVKGVAEGCLLSDCSMIGGETAELPDIYKKGDFDLAGFAVGVCELDRMIDGSKAKAGDVILGIRSSGVHSNGYTLVRAIVKEAKLDLKKIYPKLDSTRTLGEVLLTPTRIYTKSIVSMLGQYRVKQPVTAMAHITGGGLPGNIPRVLGSKLDAKIRLSSWKVPPVFDFLKRHGHVEKQEMFRVFNMGIGYVVIVKPTFAAAIVKKLTKAGENVTTIGKIVKGTGCVKLV